MKNPDINLRAMIPADLPAVRLLLKQLGYDVAPDEVKRRFEAVNAFPGHTVLVAELNGRIVAFLHLYARPALEKPPEAIVQSLVVDQACRKMGIGKRMMQAAEQWAREQGFQSIALSSNIQRDDVHAFYQKLGYRNFAISHFFRKDIGLDPETEHRYS